MSAPASLDKSVVLSLNADDTRLAYLALSTQRADPEDKTDGLQPIFDKVGSAEGVLKKRGWLKQAESNLISGRDTHAFNQAIQGDTVDVRLDRDSIATIVRGLSAFMERENPSRGLDDELIDPVDKVNKTLKVFEDARDVIDARADLAKAERALLN